MKQFAMRMKSGRRRALVASTVALVAGICLALHAVSFAEQIPPYVIQLFELFYGYDPGYSPAPERGPFVQPTPAQAQQQIQQGYEILGALQGSSLQSLAIRSHAAASTATPTLT